MNNKKKQDDFDTSQAHCDSKGEWKFYVNDELVTQEVYVQVMEDHMKWCREQEESAAKANEDITPSKKTKKK